LKHENIGFGNPLNFGNRYHSELKSPGAAEQSTVFPDQSVRLFEPPKRRVRTRRKNRAA
jgi:hypothetical protein